MARFYGGTSLLPSSRVYTGAKAEGEIVQTQAGRARWLVEYLRGGNAGDATTQSPPVMVPCHSNTAGHDHSGGFMGVPIVRPLAWFTFGYDDALVAPDLTNGQAPATMLSTTTLTSIGRYPIFDGSFKHVWVPGCPVDSTAHRRGNIRAGVYYGETGGAGAATLYFRVTGMDGRAITYNTALAAGENHFEFGTGADDCVSLIPGRANRIQFQCWLAAATLGAGTQWASLLYVTLNQIQTTA
jgi:hypothetical protein